MKKFFLFILVLVLLVAGALWYISQPVKQTPSPFQYTINTDTSSNLALIGSLPNEAGFVLYTKKLSDGTEVADSISILGDNGSSGQITLGANGLPETYSYDDAKVQFSNYTESSVDILIINPDGTTESKPVSPINLGQAHSGFVNQALAQAGGLGTMPSYAPQPATGKSRSNMGDDAGFVEYLTSTPGTAANIVVCGAGLALWQPWAAFPCAQLTVRLVTHYVPVPGCEQELLDCIVHAITGAVVTKGPSLTGAVSDISSQSPIANAKIRLTKKGLGTLVSQSSSQNTGLYYLGNIEPGAYDMTVTKEGYQDFKFRLAVTGEQLKIAKLPSEEVLSTLSFDLGSPQKKKGLGINGFHAAFDISMAPDVTTAFDGSYTGEGETNDAVSECVGSAPLAFTIESGIITGEIDYELANRLIIDGRVDSSGSMSGTVRVPKLGSFATYSGTISGSSGSGTWDAPRIRCSGVFNLSKN